MPNKPSLVINTSPLVALAAALDDFQVLGEVVSLIVPGEVMAELQAGTGRDETGRLVKVASCCVIRPFLSALSPALHGTLGVGEAAVIHTALTEKISIVAIDERKGRRTAALHGLRVTGSLGLVLALRRRGLVASLSEAIARMKAKGIHISDDLAKEALALEEARK